MDKNTCRGLSSVPAIVEKYGIKGYHGPLYDLFQADDIYNAAIEAIAGASLFHIVVDTDETASRILEILSKEKGGRVTFMPLNRLKQTRVDFPETDPEVAFSLLSRLEFDDIYRPAMNQVFGKGFLY